MCSVTHPHLMQMTFPSPQIVVAPTPRPPAAVPLSPGTPFAPKSSSRQNCAKDMHILTATFPPISPSKKAPKLRPFSSKPAFRFHGYSRNFQPIGVYCSLNIGVSGLIQDEESLNSLYKNHQIGDIIDVIVTEDYDYEVDSENPRKLIMLTLPQTLMKKQFQQTLMNSLGQDSFQSSLGVRYTSLSDYGYPSNEN